MMMTESSDELLLNLKQRYFDPMCNVLGLFESGSEIGAGYGILRACGEQACVYLEHERGLAHLSVGPISTDEPSCSVELIAQRFPRIRALPGGEQRLSFDEQCDFVQRHWAELQRMFGPIELDETRRWLSDRAAAATAKFAKRS